MSSEQKRGLKLTTLNLTPKENLAMLMEKYNRVQGTLVKMTFAHARIYLADADMILYAENVSAHMTIHNLTADDIVPTVSDVMEIVKFINNHITSTEKEIIRMKINYMHEINNEIQNTLCKAPVPYGSLNFNALQLSTIILEIIRYINNLFEALIRNCNDQHGF
jgi:hypothetical protein